MTLLIKLGEWIFAYVIMRGLIGPFVTSLFKKWILRPAWSKTQKQFIKTESDAAIRLHYLNKRLDKGHQHKLDDCNDGACATI